jgi:hypothetical protein
LAAEITSIASVVIALAAVCIAWFQIRTGVKSTQRSNTLPVMSSLIDEFRSPDFHQSLLHLLEEMGSRAPDGGFDRLPRKLRNDAYKVCYLFEYLGALVAYGLVNEDILLSLMATPIKQVWTVMKPVIDGERKHRTDDYPPDTPAGFLVHYDYLVRRIHQLGDSRAAFNIQKRVGLHG